ncbi:MAG: PRC-barrel domain-containing protein [Clostridia bacterium]|nr:PRC-barrel domain-containing protein [Clostridia bacterium]
MELTFIELTKRDVINVADGRCLGNVVDLRLSFPQGELLGIYVPGRRKRGLMHLFDKSVIYIDQARIIKIGGDVILVNLGGGEHKPKKPVPPPKPVCPPPCPPPCPPQHQKDRNPYPEGKEQSYEFSIFGNVDGRIDVDDY